MSPGARFRVLRLSPWPMLLGLLGLLAQAGAVCAQPQGRGEPGGASAPAGPAAAAGPAFTPIEVPAEDRRGIALPGERANPVAESWERMTGPRSLSYVRNVARPTLTPFLPAPGTATGAAMIVVPGGGFLLVAMEPEGYRIGRWLADRGITAFVLKYRVQPTPADPSALAGMMLRAANRVALSPAERAAWEQQRSAAEQAAREDGLAAIRHVRTHAGSWGLSPVRVGMIGFSAGAITAIGVASAADASARPDLVAFLYGRIPADAVARPGLPPAFIGAASDDPVSPAANALAIYQRWRAAETDAELHLFEDGGHGFGGLAQGRASDQWLSLFEAWLGRHGFLADAPGGQ